MAFSTVSQCIGSWLIFGFLAGYMLYLIFQTNAPLHVETTSSYQDLKGKKDGQGG